MAILRGVDDAIVVPLAEPPAFHGLASGTPVGLSSVKDSDAAAVAAGTLMSQMLPEASARRSNGAFKTVVATTFGPEY
jgi:hypothetical protein